MKRALLLLLAIISISICFAGSKPVKLAKNIYFDGKVEKKIPNGHGSLNFRPYYLASNPAPQYYWTVSGDFSGSTIKNATFMFNYGGRKEECSYKFKTYHFGKITGNFEYRIDRKTSELEISLKECDILGHIIDLGTIKYNANEGFEYHNSNIYWLNVAKDYYGEFLSQIGFPNENYATNYYFTCDEYYLKMSPGNEELPSGKMMLVNDKYCDVLKFQEKGIFIGFYFDNILRVDYISEDGDTINACRSEHWWSIGASRIKSDKGLGFIKKDYSVLSGKVCYMPIIYPNGDRFEGRSETNLFNAQNELSNFFALKHAGINDFKFIEGTLYRHTGETVKYTHGLTEAQYKQKKADEENANIKAAQAEKKKEEQFKREQEAEEREHDLRCKRKNICPSCEGRKIHSTCNGSGICWSCQGKGGSRDFHRGNQYITCSACQGSGICFTCNGSGRCRRCGGSGKY